MTKLLLMTTIAFATVAASPAASAPATMASADAATNAAAASPQAADARVATPAAAAPEEKKICKLLPSSGTRMSKRACLTADEWKKVEEVVESDNGY